MLCCVANAAPKPAKRVKAAAAAAASSATPNAENEESDDEEERKPKRTQIKRFASVGSEPSLVLAADTATTAAAGGAAFGAADLLALKRQIARLERANEQMRAELARTESRYAAFAGATDHDDGEVLPGLDDDQPIPHFVPSPNAHAVAKRASVPRPRAAAAASAASHRLSLDHDLYAAADDDDNDRNDITFMLQMQHAQQQALLFSKTVARHYHRR